ncbi:M1 family metallopeptidase [Kribbella sp. VKM Ac-2568]|uniref:M1 family metallopeptidase n=1 Tax=Kribbella sp. VKM Ac-2568 TaxID=2512219 RepID=UPI0010517D22|nr:M1 family metallopeptidase [Kribbella sp. VKM Ac-2568]TCM38201.1 leukotriene A4 hydrolase-like protein [Kribbella sp. VKM Ac-2568]
MTHDRHSYAEPALVRTTHLELELDLDFSAKVLAGTATHTLAWSGPGDRLVLDTRDLTVLAVEGAVEGAVDGDWEPLEYSLSVPDEELGSALTIRTRQHERVRVSYRTAPTATGLQWLEPSMTAGGVLPFMFSQSQAIHARSWVPVQDTPSVRFSYAAHVTAPPELMVLMSAENGTTSRRTGSYDVVMPEPIPSYLLAIAAGDLVFERIGDRSGVWAEPEMAKRAAAEFADTEQMMRVTEALFGPYRWGRYDILVLPPSFPYGGMENPRMTFATPTVVIGDKSLVNVVAHELAHSWSGNLVTQDSWDDIWLNEGFTSYVENRIVEAVYGTELAVMETAIKQHSTVTKLDPLSLAEQAVELPGLNHGTEYHGNSGLGPLKGAWFLSWLEERFTREVFDPFLRGYFDRFAFRSINSEDFAGHLQEQLLDRHPGVVTAEEVAAWLDQPGIPQFAERADSARFQLVDELRRRWLTTGELPAGAKQWTTQEWLRFLDAAPDVLTAEQLQQLDREFGLTGTANGEIARRWYSLVAASSYTPAYEELASFLTRVGRMKLVLPVYRALADTPDGKDFALQVFTAARPGYHPITIAAVQKILGT